MGQRRALSDRRTSPPHLAAPPAPPRGPLGNRLSYKMEIAVCACARRALGETFHSTNDAQETNSLRMRPGSHLRPARFPGRAMTISVSRGPLACPEHQSYVGFPPQSDVRRGAGSGPAGWPIARRAGDRPRGAGRRPSPEPRRSLRGPSGTVVDV